MNTKYKIEMLRLLDDLDEEIDNARIGYNEFNQEFIFDKIQEIRDYVNNLDTYGK